MGFRGGGMFRDGGIYDLPQFGGRPIINAGQNMFGGGGSIDNVMSWQNPNMTQFFGFGLDHDKAMETLRQKSWADRLNSFTQLGTAGIGAGASMFGSQKQFEAAMENARIQDMIASARYGEGGLESRALEQQGALAREQMASGERVAGLPWQYKRDILSMPLLQQVLQGVGGGGQSIGLGGISPSGASMAGGPGEQLMARREMAASGRRAADEAATVKGAVEAATGPGGGGMGGGPAGAVAANRARLMRLQTGASERAAEQQRAMDMALAARGQSLGLVGGLLG